MKKEIVLIAKSVKNAQYCVAGREILRNSSNLQLGEWIRPISRHDEGAVSRTEILLANLSLPQFLDIIQISVKKRNHTHTQPENWVINKRQWQKTGAISIGSISSFVENPDNLWIGKGYQTDRISPPDFTEKGYNSSLCIIRPTAFSMVISTEYNPFTNRNKKRRRAIFRYNEVDYDLAITDPDIHEKYFVPFPGIDDALKTINMDVERCLLCVSLAPEFNGYHYKLIAKIIEHE